MVANGIVIHTVSPYDPDSEFSTSTLWKLQNAGFNFVPSLLKRYKFKDDKKKMPDIDFGVMHISSFIMVPKKIEDPLSNLVENWLEVIGRPATWRSLLEILQELSLGEMSQQIENFLLCRGMFLTHIIVLRDDALYCCRYAISEQTVHGSDRIRLATLLETGS